MAAKKKKGERVELYTPVDRDRPRIKGPVQIEREDSLFNVRKNNFHLDHGVPCSNIYCESCEKEHQERLTTIITWGG